MKFKYIFTILVILIVWEAFFAHIGVLSKIDLMAILTVNIYAVWQENRFFSLWIILVGVLLNIISIEWLGLYSFTNSIALITVLIGNSYMRFFQTEKFTWVFVIYIFVSSLTLYLIRLLIEGFDPNILTIFLQILLNIILALIIRYLFFKKARMPKIIV